MHYIGVSDRKRKRINKGTDKYDSDDPLIHSTTFHTSFKILRQVVLEKSLTENFVRERKMNK